ncbi:MAG: hypothetical protein J3Q66DRAFT_370413 [Benniella sp.]|nr:MAG: hypothetical protein J3Q66DRAFT_370413 [Benniella sp.]
MKALFLSLIALAFLTCYTSAAPIVPESDILPLLSPRYVVPHSPASDRRSVPIDICQPGRQDSASNPICNPNNYPSNRSSGSGSSTTDNDGSSGSSDSHSSDGRSVHNQNRGQEQSHDQELQERKDAGIAMANGNGSNSPWIRREDQDPRISNPRKRYVSRSVGIGSTYTKEGAQDR